MDGEGSRRRFLSVDDEFFCSFGRVISIVIVTTDEEYSRILVPSKIETKVAEPAHLEHKGTFLRRLAAQARKSVLKAAGPFESDPGSHCPTWIASLDATE